MSAGHHPITHVGFPLIVAATVELVSRIKSGATPARIAEAQSGKPNGHRGLLDLLHPLFVRPLTEAIELPRKQELKIIRLWKVVRDTTLPFDRDLQSKLVSMVRKFGWMGGNKTTAGSNPAEGAQGPASLRTRGRKRSYDPEKDRTIAEAWRCAHAVGVGKKDFAKDNGSSVKDLDRLLNRVRKRANGAD